MMLKLINSEKLDEKIYSDIQAQFPPEEIKTLEEFNDLLREGSYKLGLVYDEKILIGYILYIKKDFIWIDYIAVLQEFHSKGYGSKILTAIFEKYSSLKGCYFEVEPEDTQNPHTVRRINFYKKLGCIELQFKYYFPNPVKKLEMKLLYKSFNGLIPDKEIIKKDIEKVFKILHENVECKNEILSLIQQENA